MFDLERSKRLYEIRLRLEAAQKDWAKSWDVTSHAMKDIEFLLEEVKRWKGAASASDMSLWSEWYRELKIQYDQLAEKYKHLLEQNSKLERNRDFYDH